MVKIRWSSELDTGIQVIDEQHHRIVDYINQLYVIQESHNHKDVEKVLQELVDYTLSHFSFEESLMEDAGYPFATGHKRVHEMFKARINSFMQRISKGEDITDELLAVLRSWLLNHIRSDDNDYVEVVKTSMQIKTDKHEGEGWIKQSLARFFG